jgi:hypothetical protein
VMRQMSNDGKFQDTECFLIPCPCHVSSRLPTGGETCNYTMAPSTPTQKWSDCVRIDKLHSAVSVLIVAQQISEFLERVMNYPVCGKDPHNCNVCRVSFIIETMWIDFSVYKLGYAHISGVCVVR